MGLNKYRGTLLGNDRHVRHHKHEPTARLTIQNCEEKFLSSAKSDHARSRTAFHRHPGPLRRCHIVVSAATDHPITHGLHQVDRTTLALICAHSNHGFCSCLRCRCCVPALQKGRVPRRPSWPTQHQHHSYSSSLTIRSTPRRKVRSPRFLPGTAAPHFAATGPIFESSPNGAPITG